MSTNPYQDSATSPALPPIRRSRILKSPILWFTLGFVASCTIWSVANYMAHAPRDYSRRWPEEIREYAPEWLKDAKGRNVGQFTILASGHPKQASAWVFPTLPDRNPGQNPGVQYADTDADGRVDSFAVCDAKQRTFEFVVADGQFQSYSYTPDMFARDAISFHDGDMDGRFDWQVVPGKRYAMMVDSQWRDLVLEGGGKGYVEIDGKRVPAEYVNGNWRIVE